MSCGMRLCACKSRVYLSTGGVHTQMCVIVKLIIEPLTVCFSRMLCESMLRDGDQTEGLFYAPPPSTESSGRKKKKITFILT